MPTPRPHHKERIAHAEGYEVETLIGGKWVLVATPCFAKEMQYRVKPEPVGDTIVDCWAEHKGDVHVAFLARASQPNLRLTFDGETGQLKAAEVIGG